MKQFKYLSNIQKIITIPNNNSKIPCASVSLPAWLTCDKNIGCIDVCYDFKFMKLYPNVKQARLKNYNALNNDINMYFSAIDSYLKIKKSSFFRWHVGGDIPSIEYFDNMLKIARDNKNCNFLAFTKRYEWVNLISRKPKNLNILVSSWLNTDIPENNRYPVAWYQDGTEKRTPNNAYICNKTCYTCKFCWFTKKRSVVFNKH